MESIKELSPNMYIRYKRTFEGMRKYEVKESEEPKGYWIYGKPGSGKDYNVRMLGSVFEKSHNKWWDGYAGEKYILLPDVDRNDAKWIGNFLKIWSDCYPFNGEVKGGVIEICPERFYVTSNYMIRDLFEDKALKEALLRRFHQVDFDLGVIKKRPRIEPVIRKDLVDF